MAKIEDLIKSDPAHLLGIDVSTYQGLPKWDQVKAAGVSFVYCKATEGVSIQDKRFRENYKALKEAGLSRGAYHFFRGGNSGAKQLDNFMTQVIDLWDKDDLPPCIDIESVYDVNKVSLATQIDYILEWGSLVKTTLKVKPVAYTSLRVVRDLFKNTNKFGDFQLWTVDYRGGIDKPRIPPGFTEWVLWQFTDKTIVPGIQGPVDTDRFYKNTPESLKDFVESSRV